MKQEPNDVLSSPEAASLLKNREVLQDLLSAPETKRLMEVLSRQNGGSLQEAARQARKGDLSGLSSMLQGLTATRDGAQALENMEKKLNRQ